MADTPKEPVNMTGTQRWVLENLGGKAGLPAFSFVYGSRASRDCLKDWPAAYERKTLDRGRTRHTRTWKDPNTGLLVHCDAIEYTDYPAVEWIVHFENTGQKDTPIIENLQSIDVTFTSDATDGAVLHHARGSTGEFTDYQPFSDPLKADAAINLHSHGWRTCPSRTEPSGSPSVESMPFFNLQTGSEGLIGAFGWTGPWRARFTRRCDHTIHLQAGMDGLHLKLHPGEKIRSPRILMLFWNGDRLDAHNQWRRLLLKYYSPQPGGKPFAGLIAHCVWGNWTNADGHVADMEWYRQNDLPVDCYWMDAKWCGGADVCWAAHQSDRRPNKVLFPNGIRPVSDAAHRNGMKFLLWFVPNSVFPDTEIAKDHPDWLGEPYSDETFGDQVFYGLDHGNAEINRFMIDYYSKIIAEYGIDVFRQDGTHLWPRTNDPERLGMNQIRYNEGFYAFWDALLERNPHLIIDNCGCGGRKLDLETIRRSVIMWRSDSQATADFDPASSQAMTYGLSFWIPLYAAAVPLEARFGPYALRSAYAPAMELTWTGNPAERRHKIDVNVLRKLLNEYLAVRRCFTGDFYPLTPYSLEGDKWLAWQFDRPDLGEGVVQAFRRADCATETQTCRLRGLQTQARYQLTDPDTGTVRTITGRVLMEDGIVWTLKDRPAAAVMTYRRL